MSKSKKAGVPVFVRLYHDTDPDLIAWWEALNVPRGWKSQVVKDALRRGIEAGDQLPQLKREISDLREMLRALEQRKQDG